MYLFVQRVLPIAFFSVCLASLGGCDDKNAAKPAQQPQPEVATPAPSVEMPKPVTIDRAALAAFGVLPTTITSSGQTLSDNADAVALGKQLFFETRLSQGGDISCNSCHGLDTYGVDNKPTSTGFKGQLGGRNSPSVYNAGLHTAQFWDGRAKDLEEQALGPMLNPVEMAMKDGPAVVAVIRSIPEYAASFKKVFPADKDPVTFANIGKAIGAFERTLVTPSRWDKYLGGDDTALTSDERAGLAKFLDAGCVSCHHGVGVGGQDYRKLGLVKPWPTDIKDNGRFDVTKDPADKNVFRVPSLRNVEKTGPYFHDGSMMTLEETVKAMGTHQLGKDLSNDDVASIVTFLKSLTGTLPVIEKPTLPREHASARPNATPKSP